MKRPVGIATLLLLISLAGSAAAADVQWVRVLHRHGYLTAPAAEPAFSWAPDNVARRTRSDALLWKRADPARRAQDARKLAPAGTSSRAVPRRSSTSVEVLGTYGEAHE